MATEVQIRGGRTAWNDGFTGAEREVTVDTTTHDLRVHDGVTEGGHSLTTVTLDVEGGVRRTVAAKVADVMSTRDFDVKFDGATNDTAALQLAIDTAVDRNQTLHLAGGTAVVGSLLLRPGLSMTGVGPVQTTLKQAAGVSSEFWIDCPTEANDMVLGGFSLDGGYVEGQPIGVDMLRVFSSRPSLDNITIINSTGLALRTIHTLSDRTYSILGHFNHITIDRSAGGGWEHLGPNDSFGSAIEIVDVSLAEDLAHPGMRTNGLGTICVDNIHVWNRTTGLARPRPSFALQVLGGGQKFSNANLESGGNAALILNGGYNCFSNTAVFAPDGGVAAIFAAGWNRFDGLVGGNKDFLHPDYVGIVLGLDGGNLSAGNVIDVLDAGCTLGAVDFTYSGGNNVVRVRGYKEAGDGAYNGTPHPTDDVDIRTDGPGGAVYRKRVQEPWTAYTPTVAPSAGTLGSYVASGKFSRVGSICYVQIIIEIPTNGDAAGILRASLPLEPVNGQVLQAIDGNTLAGLTAITNVAEGVAVVATAAGGYPGGSGKVLIVSGSYEVS